MAKAGRKRKLGDAERDQFLAAVTDGASRKTAAAYVGVSHTTIGREAARNDLFRASLKKAEAACEVEHIRRIREGKGGWQSSAWFLERKWPKRWSKPESANHGNDLDRAALRRLAETLAPAATPPGTAAAAVGPDQVQDRPGGPAERQDGNSQAPSGDVP